MQEISTEIHEPFGFERNNIDSKLGSKQSCTLTKTVFTLWSRTFSFVRDIL